MFDKRLHEIQTESDKRLHELQSNTDKRVHTIENRMVLVQTVLVAFLIAIGVAGIKSWLEHDAGKNQQPPVKQASDPDRPATMQRADP